MRGPSNFSKFIMKPFEYGVLGFILFLIVVAASKFLAKLIGTQPTFKMEKEDLMLAMIGFILYSLIKVLEPFNKQKN